MLRGKEKATLFKVSLYFSNILPFPVRSHFALTPYSVIKGTSQNGCSKFRVGSLRSNSIFRLSTPLGSQ
nr:MAG TPA: hypothetical protein [Caudoviricetes sp.]DAZ03991.1 MAG TPA: hypothetical protein [Caudoviricetes sp.]